MPLGAWAQSSMSKLPKYCSPYFCSHTEVRGEYKPCLRRKDENASSPGELADRGMTSGRNRYRRQRGSLPGRHGRDVCGSVGERGDRAGLCTQVPSTQAEESYEYTHLFLEYEKDTLRKRGPFFSPSQSQLTILVVLKPTQASHPLEVWQPQKSTPSRTVAEWRRESSTTASPLS